MRSLRVVFRMRQAQGTGDERKERRRGREPEIRFPWA